MLALLMAVVSLSFAPAPEETKLGAGVSLQEATPVAALIARPDEFVGKTVRIDGVATAVCSHRGCWMAVAAADDPNGATVRLKVEDGVIVFPLAAKGKQVSAEGVFESIGTDAHNTEAAGEHARQDPKASKTYQIKAIGAIIH
jgi:hypothetical protein